MRYFSHIKKGIKLFYKRKIMPEYVTFFVTNRCNARCKHCFYWKDLNSHIKELKLDEIKKISKSMSNFLFLSITGGEPFLRNDILEIVELFYKNNNVRKMNILTNGSLPEKILKVIKQIKEKCPELYLTLFVSIDNLEKKHDKLRGFTGIYKKALKTINNLKELQKKYTKLSLGVAMTYSSFNEKDIIDIYNHIKIKFKPDTINCSYVRGDPKEKTAKNCNIKNFIKLQKIIKKDLISKKIKGVYDSVIANIVAAAKFEVSSQLIKTVKENRNLFPCYAGKINVVIYPNGDISPCEILKDKMGNLREEDYNFKKIWFSRKSCNIRKKIKKIKCYCTHECNMLPNILYNPKFLFKIIKNYLRLVFSL